MASLGLFSHVEPFRSLTTRARGRGGQRIIPITNAPHLLATVRQWWGDSRGHWEGETLVVDVTNFNAKREYLSSRENFHLIERCTRIDANTLEYQATMEDPTTWTRPWTAKAGVDPARCASEPGVLRTPMSRG